MSGQAAGLYDTRPYPWLSHSWTHPDHLGVIARLFGMSPAPPSRCRLLELGCASGGNIIPLAESLPESRFQGIDLSPTQVSEGRQAIAGLGLDNIELLCGDLAAFEPAPGEYDYIVAHGLFSWVPEAVRRRIFEICRRSLAPDGIAFISYNVYPGWHLLGAIRDMLLYHTRSTTDPTDRARAAREFISFFVDTVPADAGPFAAFVHAYQEGTEGRNRVGGRRGDDLLLHDELAETNEPFYFANFVQAAAQHDLQYVADADFSGGTLSFSAEVQARLQQYSSSLVEMEQYADFLRANTFRRSLLCRSDVTLRRRLRLSEVPIHEFRFSSAAHAGPDPSDGVAEFRTIDGHCLRTNHPVSRAAMEILIERAPETIDFDTLVNDALARARQRGHTPDIRKDSQEISATLMKGYLENMSLVEFALEAPPLTASCSTRPVASPYARWRASQGDLVLTNRRHQRVEIDEATRQLVVLLDGTRSRQDILRDAAGAADAEPVAGDELMARLQWCAASGLLCG